MQGKIEGRIVGIEDEVDYRGTTQKVVEVEVSDGNTIKVFDETGSLGEDMVGESRQMSLMFLVESAEAHSLERAIDPEEGSEPYYCLVSGEVQEKGLREHENSVLNLLSLDVGQGTVLVKFDETNGIWTDISEGDTIRVLANKIVLLDLVSN
ncbi:MAG: hypothetical protein ABEJ75_02760 [Candidatus Nanohaloarchaea archaeon]